MSKKKMPYTTKAVYWYMLSGIKVKKINVGNKRQLIHCRKFDKETKKCDEYILTKSAVCAFFMKYLREPQRGD